jgi:hypothetical protein
MGNDEVSGRPLAEMSFLAGLVSGNPPQADEILFFNYSEAFEGNTLVRFFSSSASLFPRRLLSRRRHSDRMNDQNV